MFPHESSTVSILVGGNAAIARIFEVRLTDGTILRFTDHPTRLVYQGNTYLSGAPDPLNSRVAVGSFSSTDFQALSELEPGTMDISGFFVDPGISGGINRADMLDGRYDNAEVIITWIDWRFTDLCGPYGIRRMWVAGKEFDDEKFKIQLSTWDVRLQRGRGEVITALCPHRLGQNSGGVGCFYNIGSVTEPVEVTVVADSRLAFRCLNISDRADDWSRLGQITWSSGANSGVVSKIRSDTRVSSGVHDIVLFRRTPRPIIVGDVGDIQPGCDKQVTTCVSKFNQLSRFGGGGDDLPNGDERFQTPNVQG